jgi:NAD(P)-dependent dehydrogenase (short-subunit alcohol dehydrogenase family)
VVEHGVPSRAGGLAGRRLLVVGASSGIGRAVALGAAGAGAALAVSARRGGLVEEVAGAARAAGAPRAAALPCDTTDPDAALALGPRAADALGGLDTVVYAAGVALLIPVAEMSPEDWHQVLHTNVVGAALVVSGALEVLRAGAGDRAPTVAFLSSQLGGRPAPWLVAYSASKAALDSLAHGLRDEEPWLRVVDVVVGNTLTSFADHWDPDATRDAFARWTGESYLDDNIYTAEETATLVLGAIADPEGPVDVFAPGLAPPGGPVTSAAT